MASRERLKMWAHAALPGLGLEVGAGGPSAPLAAHTRQFSPFLKDGSAA